MFKRVLVANRGVIACRIMRTLRKLGIEPVAIYSEADAGSLHVEMAAQAICVGPAPAAESYLNADAILAAAVASQAEAIHPGYGFLSENPEFAEKCEARGITFIGPTSAQIRSFGLKNTAREIAVQCGAPILPGSGLLRDADHAIAEATRIGFPVMLKSAGGGGGIGMRLCETPESLIEAFESVQRLSETHFKGSGIYLERFVASGRHIEVQVFGDGAGQVITLGERDCSVQRRNQKIIEETPAPGLSDATRRQLADVATRVMQAVNYRSAGTVEFLYDTVREEFYFLEVNTRLQVEHGVTEEVTRIDLVEWMVRLADGSLPPLDALRPNFDGASIQVRLYAESPIAGFQPSSGRVTYFQPPTNCRVETFLKAGVDVSQFYDPLLAKIIAHGGTRDDARRKLAHALSQTKLTGLETNLEFLHAIVADPLFATGGVSTRFLSTFTFRPHCAEVIEGGVLTTVQSFPGRLGYWNIGVPPSGPMDDLSFRLGNELLGNDIDAAGLECTLTGPTLRFHSETQLVITGADMQPTLDGKPVSLWTVLPISPGSVLALSSISGPGARTYILFRKGLNVPPYLGSTATFTLGNFGGLTGRQLRTGDLLPLLEFTGASNNALPEERRPTLTHDWKIGVMYGPHGAPDFFTEKDIASLFSTAWKVHHNSSRTGVRLLGPKPEWARQDGGDAGLHPSNIHDNAYAIGSIDFTGDMPILLGPDGPSLGGFVCPGVVLGSELWKLGQLSPGDTVRFENRVDGIAASPLTPVVRKRVTPPVVTRQAGDRNLLIEFGEPVLDLNLRFRVHALMHAVEQSGLDGVIDLTPGIRSLQIHYSPSAVSRNRLLDFIDSAVADVTSLEDTAVPTRIVHLPLSWDDPATQLAIQRYMTSVRPDAPWCPSNLEFIRRVNGLNSIEDVHRIVFSANYLVLGLGDVYLGAPVATPIDPSQRLVTTKYNPARTWTPENAVGIGGAYLCVYGMEGPGGYQFVGRTVQMWNTYRTTREFEPGKPWLLRFFDQIRFFPVSGDELLEMRRDFPLGRYSLQIEEQSFRLRDYNEFWETNKGRIDQFRSTQKQAFAEERARWAVQGEFDIAKFEGSDASPSIDEHAIPAGCQALRAPTAASVWTLNVEAGIHLQAGQRTMVLEAMKMEIAIMIPVAAEVVEVLCHKGATVTSGQPLLIYRPAAQ